ncbi:30S ribosomal protein S4 [candidate division WOR-1 bacterium RIFCSPLOWO2_02_FULL_46_20]|uniref:Small ribosomal subunit protein uS4 n=2 Tax=Saganbacteria TaxID=1703751 RepID=A0A1F4R4T5_UNCSA|nr:MAG: 30S ribosomal protein S4 [candidate division WOR-1 bacterium RIFCSPHIGHO2_02_FULL_45_12]OGC03251.1 MAG: 30S ribosomal protein S4 [candidate division WOR-1 bacterium RIFCSPLOWO2_02_FULL_46_20]OGC08897.1 MAG: 30S ribosomal protein S4 [candidate division WOR-1 bacterium RIFCSPLOWO2_12_FULL_45_9]
MGRHTEAKCKLCRREKEKLFLKGDKCFSEKCPVVRRAYPPGQHGKTQRVRISEYGIRLREKQKARRIYGLTERQFEGYFDKASKGKGATGDKLLEFLERRLDNVVFRLGFAASRQSARQIVHHGGVLVNGRKVDVPSFQVSADDQIKFSLKIVPLVKAMIEKSPDHTPPAWLVRSGAEEGKMASIPKREEIDAALEDHLIVEYYSR